MDAFDADVLIYAAIPGHHLGRKVAALFPQGLVGDGDQSAGVGSLLLLPEILAKPLRDERADELAMLGGLLARLELLALDSAAAALAVSLSSIYRLRAADAVHLATAVAAGADRFITNNRRDFPDTISEIDITYPDDLPDLLSSDML